MYDIIEIPQPPTKAHISLYSTIRLLGLRTDAYAFGSTYEDASKYTSDEWRKRLDTPGRVTFAVRTSSEGEEVWLGTASVLTPQMLNAIGYSPPKNVVADDEAAYMMVGMWIHPDYRRQGLGKRLIGAVRDKVREDAKETRRRVLCLQVHDDNIKAKALYDNFGFSNGGPDGDSEVWMYLAVDDGV